MSHTRSISAAIYTQTSNVEVEVNGLITYDREVVKMDLDHIVEAANKLHFPSLTARHGLARFLVTFSLSLLRSDSQKIGGIVSIVYVADNRRCQ